MNSTPNLNFKPKHILFMCVANSARSQMAEGIAKAIIELNDENTIISSAGSQPTSVRPEAVEVLLEIGIDISLQYSKFVKKINSDSIDLVITLCQEEVCPVFLGKAEKLHWGMPDPAAITGSDKDRLDAFRQVRDDLYAIIKKELPLFFN